MKKALVFGKYMPPHKGHLALIDFALSKCENVIVSMSFTPNDPISPTLRFDWLKAIFDNNPRVQVVQHLDDFNDENLPLFEATKLWADFINQEFPDIDAFFCSEDYGEPLSFHLKKPCIIFDKKRIEIPISASKIRQNPFQYWDYIPQEVKPYFLKRICLFGPESVGKTMLSAKLADYFKTIWVEEAARTILKSNDEIDEQRILEIGQKQTDLVNQKSLIANKILFCDTDLITTQIYARHYLGFIPPKLIELEKEVKYDLYFLLGIDSEWIYDPLRDLGNRRKEMFEVFKSELEKRQIPYILINGNWEERFEKMVELISKWVI
jgi:HTH-type transcriptional regulator, transcriptional repressor of NAD biosynthesis genes